MTASKYEFTASSIASEYLLMSLSKQRRERSRVQKLEESRWSTAVCWMSIITSAATNTSYWTRLTSHMPLSGSSIAHTVSIAPKYLLLTLADEKRLSRRTQYHSSRVHRLLLGITAVLSIFCSGSEEDIVHHLSNTRALTPAWGTVDFDTGFMNDRDHKELIEAPLMTGRTNSQDSRVKSFHGIHGCIRIVCCVYGGQLAVLLIEKQILVSNLSRSFMV